MKNRIITYLILVLLINCKTNEQEEPGVDYDVIVVGAGAAGMYAAYHLNRKGINVMVLEASSTHGGRAQYNKSFSDGFIELGPEIVYSSPDFPTTQKERALRRMKHWAKKEGYDITRLQVKSDSVFFEDEFWDVLPDSGLFKVDIYKDAYQLDSTILHEYMYDVEYENVVMMDNGKVIRGDEDDTYEKMWELVEKVLAYDGPSISITEALKMEGIDSGSTMWRWIDDSYGASADASSNNHIYTSEGYDFYDYIGGESYYSDIPYKDLLDTLYFHELHENDLIIYNSPVTHVNYEGDVVTVTDENGNSYTAEYVIVTVSVEVLKSEMIAFTPKLPEKKIQAYNGMALQPGYRLYLKFREPIWEKDSIFEIMGLKYGAWCMVPSRYYGEGVADKNVLMCMPMSDRVKYLEESGLDVVELVVKELDEVFGGTIATDNFVDAFYMNWKLNPYIGGVHSYPTKDMWPKEGPSIPEIIGQSVDGKVFFGGEA
ncbi:MAG: FAD-dependent oxidoreductase, partial [Bacteroidetes bacterium]|nr:FAD-dependent oxidoreductase [Bacteroidota bacterium]